MGLFRTLSYRIRALARKAHLDREADEEMRFHIEMLAADYEKAGLPKHEALRQAKIDFGGLERMKENLRDARGVLWIETIMRDISLTLRQLRKSPGFTFVAIATLALGIGACTAMFSVVNSVILKPLPVEKPNELVWFTSNLGEGLSAQTHRIDNFEEFRDQNESFSSMGAYFAFFDFWSILVDNGSGDGSDRIRGAGITLGFLDTLGVKPMIGRDFTEAEYQAAINESVPSAILSHSYWQRRFNGDPNIIGTSVHMNSAPTEIIGVMPPSFEFDSIFTPGTEVEALVAFPLIEQTNNWGNVLSIVGRLNPGVSIEQAQAELEVISERIRTENPNTPRFYHGVNTAMLDDWIRGPYRTAFYVLAGAVVCVLAIACANLANLLIARSNSRRKEFALRSALGAKRGRLIRQTLTESFLLAAGGCLLGAILAIWATKAISGLQAFSIPLLQTASVDTQSIVFVILISCAAGFSCGILPALQLSQKQPATALREDGQRGSSSARSNWLRRALVGAEVALACCLLIGAGLLIRSFESLISVDVGFDQDNAIAWRIDSERQFANNIERSAYYVGIAERIAALPTVEHTGLTDALPLGRNRSWGVQAKGEEGKRGPGGVAFPRIVSYGCADAMGIKVQDGRFFNAFDTADTQQSIVINEEMARRYWPEQNPIGQIAIVNGREYLVIGIVDNVKHSSLDADDSPEMYLLMSQQPDYASIELVVRSSAPKELLIAQVEQALEAHDSSIPTGEYTSLDTIVGKSVAPQRLIMRVLSGFSAAAIALAAIGLYGVISYTVGQRSKEIGIRMAIGAKQRVVLRLIMKESLQTVGAGVVAGIAAAFAFSRYLESLLFEVNATDPWIFASNATLVLGVSLIASIHPALRATKIDPVKALREE
ncbi:ABC transporter permease [Pelagicoccus mobilis]|uniref:ABC transporter permease n=1 Tax=Pelagicoccus mobilis TaxID=415221 RepID=A0A934VRV8_9BACT|nr:ABC transporter permease [Pelagicoccus mobilis]MBK1878018.1 ABC transporter permease [Pelagicoccus mobilis]